MSTIDFKVYTRCRDRHDYPLSTPAFILVEYNRTGFHIEAVVVQMRRFVVFFLSLYRCNIICVIQNTSGFIPLI